MTVSPNLPWCPVLRAAAPLIVTLLVLGTATPSVAASGALTQLAGVDGCVSETGTSGQCEDGRALSGARSVAVSSDGRNGYAASQFASAADVFARDRRSGAFDQLTGTDGCVSETGTAGACADGHALRDASSITVSLDGRNAYVASQVSDAVVAFARDRRDGTLTQLAGQNGCVSETGTLGECEDGRALDVAISVSVSLDGRNVYVASLGSDAVAAFARNPRTGALTQLHGTDGCISETGSGGACADGKALDGARSVQVSSDGRNVYVASQNSDAVAVFARDRRTGALSQLPGTDGCISETGSGGACADGKALDDLLAVGLSLDGRSAYTTAQNSDAVAVFARDFRTGALSQLPGTDGCVSETGSGGECADGKALDGSSAVTVSPDGRNVYVTALVSDAVSAFARDRRTGALVQLPGTDGCVSETGTAGACADGKALDGATAVTVSLDGRNVYVAAFNSRAVAAFARRG